ncbi:MAG: hypothetical protein M5U26_15855 [Planctomycetota bacterium]|nr:hypothetical protein [Planctomycetota bacterium]
MLFSVKALLMRSVRKRLQQQKASAARQTQHQRKSRDTAARKSVKPKKGK